MVFLNFLIIAYALYMKKDKRKTFRRLRLFVYETNTCLITYRKRLYSPSEPVLRCHELLYTLFWINFRVYIKQADTLAICQFLLWRRGIKLRPLLDKYALSLNFRDLKGHQLLREEREGSCGSCYEWEKQGLTIVVPDPCSVFFAFMLPYSGSFSTLYMKLPLVMKLFHRASSSSESFRQSALCIAIIARVLLSVWYPFCALMKWKTQCGPAVFTLPIHICSHAYVRFFFWMKLKNSGPTSLIIGQNESIWQKIGVIVL